MGRIKTRSMDPREAARRLLRYRSTGRTYEHPEEAHPKMQEATEEAEKARHNGPQQDVGRHTWRPDRRFYDKCGRTQMPDKSVLFAVEAEKEAPWWSLSKGKRYFHVYAYQPTVGEYAYAYAVEYRTGPNRDAECRGIFDIGLDQLQHFIEYIIQIRERHKMPFTFTVHKGDQSVKLHNLRFQPNPYTWEGSDQTKKGSLKVVRIFDATQKVAVSHAPFLLVGNKATALAPSPNNAAVKNVLLFNPSYPDASRLFERHDVKFEKGDTFDVERFQTEEGDISYFTTSTFRTFSTITLPQKGEIHEVDAEERTVGVELADLINEREYVEEIKMMTWAQAHSGFRNSL